jgi:hypothetical protein
MNNQLIENGISSPAAVTKKAISLGIPTENRTKAEIIRDIQKAEGYEQCFGTCHGECTHLECSFRTECINLKEQVFLSQVKVPKLNYSTIVPWSVTIAAEWIEKGIIVLPRGLTKYLEGTNTLHTLYEETDDVLPYYEDTRIVEGMDYYYNLNEIRAGDTIHLQLKSLNPTKIKCYLGWLKNTSALMAKTSETAQD